VAACDVEASATAASANDGNGGIVAGHSRPQSNGGGGVTYYHPSMARCLNAVTLLRTTNL